jgi:hypothetical protein
MTTLTLSARRLLGLAALVPVAAATAACTTSSSGASPHVTVPVTAHPSASSTPTGPPECATASLHVKLGSGKRATGAINYHLDFTNAGSATCSLQGFPAVALVTAGTNAGNLIGGYANPTRYAPSKQIVLAAGQTAHAQLSHFPPGNNRSCHPVTAHWLKVYLPHQAKAAYLPFTTRTCAVLAGLTLAISAFVAGA